MKITAQCLETNTQQYETTIVQHLQDTPCLIQFVCHGLIEFHTLNQSLSPPIAKDVWQADIMIRHTSDLFF